MESINVELAPIALFAFRRLSHLKFVVEALQRNDLAAKSLLYVFCDGPRSDADVNPVQDVQNYVKGIEGFAEIQIVSRAENLGLARSIISGVTQILKEHGRVIVVEDDLVTSRHFLTYMNDALARYEHVERVASVHAYMYPVDTIMPETFFLKGADCWGWATWARAWSHFEEDPRILLERLSQMNLTDQFDLDGAYGFTSMLRDFADGKNNSWAIRWHASTFTAGMLTLYPRRSLVKNIGLDSTGTHEQSTEYETELESEPIHVEAIPVEECLSGREALKSFFRRMVSGQQDIARSESTRNQGSLPTLKDGDPSSQKFYSLNELDRKLRKRISKREGFYVELGANDGVNQSNTLHFERELGWTGVLIEPIPHRYLECIANRSFKNKFFCNACVSNVYDKEYVKMKYSNLMSIATEISSDISDAHQHAERGFQFLPEHERIDLVFGAVARTLTSILQEAQAPTQIDLLSLDVEGAEYNVLSGLDFSNFSFEYILVEVRNLQRVSDLLLINGYRCIEALSEHDYLFSK